MRVGRREGRGGRGGEEGEGIEIKNIIETFLHVNNLTALGYPTNEATKRFSLTKLPLMMTARRTPYNTRNNSQSIVQ